MRVAVSILLREMCVIGAKIDINRGLPIIHMNLFGYDEQSHRRGPRSRFAIWSLKGIDYAIKRVWRDAMRARRRDYDVWIYSDHGQSAATPYHRVAGQSLQAAVAQARSHAVALGSGDRPTEAVQVHDRATHAGHYPIWPRPRNFEEHGIARSVDALDDFRIAALGPVGFIYLREPATFDETVDIAEQLVSNHGIPAVIARGVEGGPIAFTSRGRYSLPEEVEALCGPEHPCLEFLGEDLSLLCHHRNAGDLTILGWCHGAEPLTFAFENGSHAGITPAETGAFAMLPRDAPLGVALRPLIRPADIRRSALALLGRAPRHEIANPVDQRRERRPDLIRVMTYNAHSCIGTDGRLAPERVARVIAQFEPDVVALQELDAGRPRTCGHHQAELIAEFLQMQYYFHPAIHVEEERYGNAILTRLPERLVRTGILPRSGTGPSEPRGALWIAIEFNGSRIQVFNTHLGLSAWERRLQARELVGEHWLGHESARGPCIVCGDLNALPNSAPWRILSQRVDDVQTRLSDHRPLGTFHSHLPKARLDHVLVSRDFTVEAVHVPRSHLSRITSDHLPLIVDLRLP
jgi:endonuclease/exonuclease/phosphatase family metal-dependent hydrolase